MTFGLFIAVASWIVAGLVQLPLDASLAANTPVSERLNVFWQLGPYLLLTLAEVLVSTTGLEFAYSQAPPSMKSTLMSFWNLTVAVANLGVSQVSKLLPFKGASLFFFWASTALVAAVALAIIARRYVPVEFYRKAP
jgi:POT family proton-dependent oligopeptide transporter